ncbi:MAG: SpoIVB peptidase, partial [Clostridia bacterium]|nr:SpoIVB peptidase [Clostridia bacterium]
NYGLYGELNSEVENGMQVTLGSKSDATPGTAYIYTTIDGNAPQKYEIQIIKTASQSNPSEKSMVLRIIDQRLLDTTGGIVQGMSGSPIIQNDKLIGAVTHVFVSDPTKGYGIYIDWMQP